MKSQLRWRNAGISSQPTKARRCKAFERRAQRAHRMALAAMVPLGTVRRVHIGDQHKDLHGVHHGIFESLKYISAAVIRSRRQTKLRVPHPEHATMNTLLARISRLAAISLIAWSASTFAAAPMNTSPLAGTWTLVAADVLHADGSRTSDFGVNPKGVLLIDGQGRYSLQIFRADRPRFSAGDKAKGSEAEYKAAVMGSSTHFGTVRVDEASGELIFHIDGASFPNWEGQEQHRHYELKDGVLSYRVPPRPNGDVPVSVWKRVEEGADSH